MLIPPSKEKGAVVLKTKFGDVAADAFSQPIEELMLDEEWKKTVGLEGGPFCYMESQLEIPF